MTYNYLLVDDVPGDLIIVKEAFEELDPDSTLVTARSGQEALDLLRSGVCRPDVMLLDIHMPGMSGFEVLAALKQDPRLRTIPVVMLSTSQYEPDITQAYTLHASSYLVKSSDFQGFLGQIDKFLTYWRANRVRATPVT